MCLTIFTPSLTRSTTLQSAVDCRVYIYALQQRETYVTAFSTRLSASHLLPS